MTLADVQVASPPAALYTALERGALRVVATDATRGWLVGTKGLSERACRGLVGRGVLRFVGDVVVVTPAGRPVVAAVKAAPPGLHAVLDVLERPQAAALAVLAARVWSLWHPVALLPARVAQLEGLARRRLAELANLPGVGFHARVTPLGVATWHQLKAEGQLP